MRVGLLLSTLGALTLASAARPDSPPPDPAELAFFESKVRPVLVARCQKCHSSAAKKQRGGLLLDSRSAILQGGDSGPAAVAGKPDDSLLVKAVRYHADAPHMPPSGKLPEREVAVLEEWVRRGVPYPNAAAVAATKTHDIEKGRQFWSFQPLREVAPPAVRLKDWPRQRIDAFVLAAMEQHGLSPSAEADRRSLIRRVTFDLIGLPPAPDDVEAFVGDTSPNAYERLVERLLASPQHGERWARFWLDLVRYADVTEQWADCKGAAWLYRDWVVKALNDDLPYDVFVQRQLASDLMPGATPADRAALGFLGLGPTYWKELKLDHNAIRTVVAEEWEERIQALGGAFLGLTLACARCHDHKFDPVTQKDYYALAGVFASVRQVDRPLVADDIAHTAREARVTVKHLESEIDKLQKTKPVPPDALVKVVEWKRQIGELRKTPHFDDPLVPAVEETSLHVVPDGPHRTKLEYRPGAAQDVAMQVRGNPAVSGPVVPRRFLEVLSAGEPKPFTQGSGRLELARAIVTDGGPLAARVIVNRVWAHHFGRGLVDTPSDFGSQGSRPSHPELLDDLAARFVAGGWSLRWLHREIVLSAAYRQGSAHEAKKAALDPDNRWLGRANRRRLEVEAWRDAMLAVGGTLDPTRGGPSLELGDANNRRRTLYGTVRRRELSDVLRLHDFPDPVTHSSGRVPTTTPLQQLFTLNSPFLRQQATALAERLKKEAPGGTEERVRRAYLLLYGRPATERQVRLATEFLTPESDAAWLQYAQALLMSNEFLFVD
jgi:hypothetical protein